MRKKINLRECISGRVHSRMNNKGTRTIPSPNPTFSTLYSSARPSHNLAAVSCTFIIQLISFDLILGEFTDAPFPAHHNTNFFVFVLASLTRHTSCPCPSVVKCIRASRNASGALVGLSSSSVVRIKRAAGGSILRPGSTAARCARGYSVGRI